MQEEQNDLFDELVGVVAICGPVESRALEGCLGRNQ
jgi:hypothetical protein